MKLQPYPAYKDSGMPWLGQIPAHWEAGAIRRRLKQHEGIKIGPFGSQLKLEYMVDAGYKVYGQANVIASDFNRGKKYITEEKFSELSACEIRSGDLLLTMMGTTGRCAVVPEGVVPGIMDSHLLRLRLRPACFVPEFVALVIDRAFYLKEQVAIEGKGSIMHGLNSGIVKNLIFAIPPLDEQSAIVRFLAYADHPINRLIRAKRRLITLLNEQKQAIIHRVVTRGLDPDVPLKPSGIDWIGDIPAHWETRPAKFFFREVDERSISGEQELLSVSHLTGVTPRSQKNITMFMAESYVGHKLCRPNDLVVNTMWAWMGALGVSSRVGIVSPSYAVYRPINSNRYVPEFVDFLLRTKPYISEYFCRSTGIRSSRLRLYPEQFLTIPLIRPSVDEQQSILSCIREKTCELNKAIEKAQREIDLIREYRTRLIADVVTGKLDVRGAALPVLDDSAEWDSIAEEIDAEEEDKDEEEIEDAED